MDAALRELTQGQLVELLAFDILEPGGDSAADMRMAKICRALAGGKLNDYLHSIEFREKGKAEGLTPDEILRRALGGR